MSHSQDPAAIAKIANLSKDFIVVVGNEGASYFVEPSDDVESLAQTIALGHEGQTVLAIDSNYIYIVCDRMSGQFKACVENLAGEPAHPDSCYFAYNGRVETVHTFRIPRSETHG
jgi:hypothetical protein